MVGGKSGRVLAGGVGVAAVLLLIGATWFKHEERHVKFFPATAATRCFDVCKMSVQIRFAAAAKLSAANARCLAAGVARRM